MGILSMAGDRLKYDPLKEDPAKHEYDPLGKSAGKRVATYDQDYGFAMLPEEKAVAEGYKGQVNDASTQQRAAIDQYKSSARKAMATADKTANGILDTARSNVANIRKPTVETIPVRVVDASGTKIEATYNVPRTVADELSKQKGINSSWVDNGAAFNVSVRGDGGKIMGKELHEMIGKISDQVLAAEEMNQASYDTAVSVGNSQVKDLESEVATQRNIAQRSYDQAVSQGEETYGMIQEKWTTFLTDQRTAFREGQKANVGGIGDLINSGALVVKGSK